MSIEKRMKQLGIELPEPAAAGGRYRRVVAAERFVYVSGQTPKQNGALTAVGKLGADVTVAEGEDAARLATLNCLSQLDAYLGGLDQVAQVAKLTGYVASAAGFGAQPAVMDGASALLEDVFGEAGGHARTAIGVAELPDNAAVEVDLVVMRTPSDLTADGPGGRGSGL